jgi:Spy/CpxP family protein refolding chaperone
MKALLFLVALLIGALVSAQDMDMMSRMFTSPTMLMSQPDFKKELKLTKEQDKKITEISKAQQKKMQEASNKARGSGNDMVGGFGLMAEMQKSQDEADAAIVAELSPDQARRLRQLQWQILGGKAFYEADLQKELGLSEEQIAKVTEYKEGDSARMMETMTKNSGAKMANAMKKLREERLKTMLAILTPDQVAKHKAALGPESKAAKRAGEQVF